MPHTREFLDLADPTLILFTTILEVTESGSIIRFMGTALVELWGSDHTNTIFGAGLPEPAIDTLRANCDFIATHPCGMAELAEFTNPSGRPFFMESIMLPLAVDEGRPLRLCSFSHSLDEVDAYEDKGSKYRTKRRVGWMDVGSGVPLSGPLETNLGAGSVG
jgi:hypothetical protein